MERVNFNPEWYGVQAKVLSRSERQMVVDYGCNGRGIVKNYSLFEGIQLCFLDFETDESMRAQKFNPDILQITHCQTGRYECEFANHTVAYLPTGYFSVATTAHLPTSFSFPLGKYYGVSLVIDRQALSDEIRRMMRTIPIDLDKIGTTLGLETQWYIRLTELIPELLDMVDTGQIKFNPAVELSYLASEEQKDFLSAMDYAQAAPSLSQAQRIKKLAQEGECTLDAMCEIMNEIKKGELDRVTFKTDSLRKYFPKSYTNKQMEDKIIQLLEQWQKKREKSMER